MTRPRYMAALPYLGAIAIVATATLLRALADPILHNRQPFAVYIVAMILAARFCGFAPSLLALVLSALTSRLFFISPRGSLTIASSIEQGSFWFFVLIGLFLSFLMRSERRARQEAKQKALIAIEKQQELEREIAERKRTDASAREAEERFRAFMDNSPAIAWAKDEQGRYVYLSKSYEQRFNVRLDDWRGKTDFEIWPQDLAQGFWESDQKVLASGVPIQITDLMMPIGKERIYWLKTKFLFQDSQDRQFVGGVGLDVTDLKQIEDSLRTKQDLLRSLIEVQENEKQFLCHEFHDGLIQYAAGSLMSLEGYRANRPATENLSDIDKAVSNLRKGVEDGRRVIRGIRPAVLDDSGLEAAIDDLIGQFKTSGIMVTSKCDPQIGRLPDLIQTTIYRVVQEALNNAGKHSGTDVVRIELNKTNGDLRLEVKDFGCGFDVQSARKRGFGLLGMSERVRLLGGECVIHSEQDSGTQISVRLPIPVTS
jgi:PAS domain S-box-containing protein